MNRCENCKKRKIDFKESEPGRHSGTWYCEDGNDMQEMSLDGNCKDYKQLWLVTLARLLGE